MFKKEKVIEKYYYNVLHQKIDFDYEKLAKEMVKAQQEAEEQKLEELEIDEVKEKANPKTPVFVGLMAISTALVFVLLSVLSFAFSILFGLAFFKIFDIESWQTAKLWVKICFGAEYWLVIFAVFFFGMAFLASAIELFKEKDRNFVMSAFSGITGFAAFVVALIALFQSNGATEIIPYLEEIKNLLIK